MTSYIPTNGDSLFEKGLPSNLEAERSILGAILLDNAVCDQAIELMRREDFFLDSHRRIYEKMIALSVRGTPIDLVTLSDELRRAAEFEQIGGATYIASLIDGVPRTDTIKHYVRLVKNKSYLRKLISVSGQIRALAFEEADETDVIIAEAEKLVLRISEESRSRSDGAEHVAVIGARLCDFYEDKALDHSKLIGLSTGFKDIDRLTLGLAIPSFTLIAARPSMGKTALSVNMACHAARAGGSVYFYTAEGSAEQIVQRILASEAKVDSQRMRQGYMHSEEWDRLNAALANLSITRFVVDDTADLTPAELFSRARQYKTEQGGLDLLVVDGIQLWARKIQGRRDLKSVVSEISASLVKMDQALNVPVLGTAQLSRNVDDRPGHRPQKSDLADDANLERDADLLLFLLREEEYQRTDENAGVAKVIFGKQREGRTDRDVHLAFIKEYTRFEDMWSEPAAATPQGDEEIPRPRRRKFQKTKYTGPNFDKRPRDEEE